MGIVCTCLPAIHKFIRHYFNKNQESPVVELPLAKAANCAPMNSVLISGSNAEDATRSSGTGTAEVHGSVVYQVRPVASDKCLLVTASRCND